MRVYRPQHLASILVLVILICSGLSQGQSQPITIWGPGEGYRLTYLHSGQLTKNGTLLVNFENEPRTEFTLGKVSNDAYNYVYLGYGELQLDGTILLNSLDIPNFGTLVLPIGSMPVMLPLAYNEEDDFLHVFADKMNLLNTIDVSSIPGLPPIYRFNVSQSQSYLTLNFEIKFNQSFSLDQAYFTLPLLIDYNKDIQFSNGTMFGEISYSFKTGVLFTLEYTIIAYQTNVNNPSEYYFVDTSQRLDFVAIIPPGSIVSGLNIEILAIFGSIILVPVLIRNIDKLFINAIKSRLRSLFNNHQGFL